MKTKLYFTPYQVELLEILLDDAIKSNKRKAKDGSAYDRRLKEYKEMHKHVLENYN